MESKIYLQVAINKHCYFTNQRSKDVKRMLKEKLNPGANASKQDQHLSNILNGNRKYLKPFEYNVFCDNLEGCTEFLLNNGKLKN